MTRLYLVTGSLGAGKTTLLKELMHLFDGCRLAVVVNDFGRERVDATLLETQGIVLKEANNGSIFCACRAEQFGDALTAVLAGHPDIILVEASGLSDPTHIQSMLLAPSLAGLKYAGAICLIDAARFHKVRDTALVCRQQLAAANGVVINKVDLATAEQLAAVHADIARFCPSALVLETTFGVVSPEWISRIKPNEPGNIMATTALHVRDVTLQRLTLEINTDLTRTGLQQFLAAFVGDTYRIKGFVALTGEVVLIDCVGDNISLSPWTGPTTDINHLTVLFGNGLPARASIRRALTDINFCDRFSCPYFEGNYLSG